MNKRGMTLMELLVYMAIVGIVVVVAGTAFTNSTKMRIRTEGKLSASQLAENVGLLFSEDVAQMGAKSTVSGTNTFSEWSEVHMPVASGSSTTDNSSFKYSPRSGVDQDSLTFRRVKYGDDGSFKRVEEISWYVNSSKELIRSCVTVATTSVAGTADENCPVTNPLAVKIAEDVEQFIVTPAKPGVLQTDYSSSTTSKYPTLLPSSTDATVESFRLIPRYGEDGFAYTTTTPSSGGSSIAISGFASNYDFDEEKIKTSASEIVANQLYVAPATNAIGSWKDLCTNISELTAGVEYEISFAIPYASGNASRTFCPGRDHMSVGFRNKADGSKISNMKDFLFYPPAADNGSTQRIFRFTPTSTVKNACMAFTFVIYSPQANSGTVSISSLTLKRVESSNYVFVDNYSPATEDKQNVKAFRLQLKVLKHKEAGETTVIIPTPSNGNKS